MFLKLVQAEILKTKKIPILRLYLLLILGLLGYFFYSFYILSLAEYNMMAVQDVNSSPWFSYYFGINMIIYVILLPLVISVSTFVIKNIEDKADAWKRIFLIPYPIYIIHTSKLIVIWLYASLFVIISFVITILSGILLSALKPDFAFTEYPTYHKFLVIFFLKYEVAALAIAALGYACILTLKRTVIGLLISIFLPFVGLFFESPYSSALYQYMGFISQKARMKEGVNSYENLQITLIGKYEIICLIITILSLCVILYKSKRLTIDYE